ncbi:hypothetical protein [Haliscomenobacter sp.]|uniref:hypothetical protein n=1 Tax=Haliscomenobacter sp. TaxID=2717303 RepID=UPI0035934E79
MRTMEAIAVKTRLEITQIQAQFNKISQERLSKKSQVGKFIFDLPMPKCTRNARVSPVFFLLLSSHVCDLARITIAPRRLFPPKTRIEVVNNFVKL